MTEPAPARFADDVGYEPTSWLYAEMTESQARALSAVLARLRLPTICGLSVTDIDAVHAYEAITALRAALPAAD